MNDSKELPICNSIILCDCIIEDKRTNNKTLVGLFNAIFSPDLPYFHPRLFVMVSLTGLKGQTPLSLNIRDPEMKEFIKIKGEAACDDPLVTLDLVFEIQGLIFHKEGVYHIDVECGKGAPIANRRFNIVKSRG